MVKRNKLITAANFRDFDWNKAKFLYHIAKCGSFSKAARLAGTDQPTLTRHIQALEKQVGCPLIIRKPGMGLTLTRKGQELLKLVAPFFLEVKGFCGHNYVEVNGEKKRKIRIVTTHALADHVINDLIISYNASHPHLIFELIGEDQEIDIILNDADIAIRPFDSQNLNVYQEHLFTLEKNLFASKGYLENYGEPQAVEALEYHHFLSYPSSAEFPYSDVTWVLRIGMPEGKLRQPVYISNSVECLIAAAKKNKGIMSGYKKMTIFQDHDLKIILPNIKDKEIKVYFICPNHLKDDQEIVSIKNYLKQI